MKKIALLFSLILVAQSAHAFIDSQHMKSEQFLVNTGYSAEAARMIAITSENPYREPYVESKKPMALLKRFHAYIVPGERNNLDFYNHSGNFDGNSWKDF